MEKEILELLTKADAISRGHFVFSSGSHAATYFNQRALFVHPIYASRVGELIATKYKDTPIDVVAAPALGGIILGQWVAYHLTQLTSKEIIGVYTEKTPNSGQAFTRGSDAYVAGKNVLIVEDILTTGNSVRKVVQAVSSSNGNIVAVCSIANINTNPQAITDQVIGAKFSCLAEMPVSLYTENECPMCKKGEPVSTQLGHGKKFLEARGALKEITPLY